MEPVVVPVERRPFVHRPSKDALYHESSNDGHRSFQPNRGYQNKQPTHSNNGTSHVQYTYSGRMNRRGR
jgi:hypothetical protein